MAGKKGKRHFGSAIIDEVLQMKATGITHREISERFGFENKKVIDKLIERYNRKQRQLELGVIPRTIGRPRKNEMNTAEAKDVLI